MRRTAAACAAILTLQLAAFGRAGLGASGLDPEDREAADLSAAPVDLNSAGYEELLELPGVSASTARAIVDRRKTLGCIRSLDDLIGAGGIDPLDLARIKPYVSLGPRCRRIGRIDLGCTLGCWSGSGALRSGGASAGWAGDLTLDQGPARLRLRRRPGRLTGHGGLVLRRGALAVALGEMRGRPGHPVAVEVGRGALQLDGAAPARAMAAGDEVGGRSSGSLQTTTGTGERLRGIGLEIYNRPHVICFAGELVRSWDAKPIPLSALSLGVLRRTGLELWTGAFGWDGQRGGCGYVSAWWKRGAVTGSAGLAARGCGAAWLGELSARPCRGRRLGLCIAGRWGKYEDPVGLGVFRKLGDPSVASRLSVAQRAGPLGDLSYEDVAQSEGEGSRVKRVVRLRRRLDGSLWGECEVRADSQPGAVGEVRSSFKVLWKPSRRVWSEFLYKSRGACSSLVGWRSSLSAGSWEVEWGGFSFSASRSLYFYETEIAGRSSIKALKGEGLGWYLYIRLEPLDGPGPLCLLGSTELKVRTVLERGSPVCGTFVGLQMSRR